LHSLKLNLKRSFR